MTGRCLRAVLAFWLVTARAAAEPADTADLFDPLPPPADAAEARAAERAAERVVSTCFIESWGHPWSDPNTVGACTAAKRELERLGPGAVAAALAWLNDRRVPPRAVKVLLGHVAMHGDPVTVVPRLITAMERWSERTQDTLLGTLDIDQLELALETATGANPAMWIAGYVCWDPPVEGRDCAYYQGYRGAGRQEIDAWKGWWGAHQNELPAERQKALLTQARAHAKSSDPKRAFLGARWLLFEAPGAADQRLAKATLKKLPEEVEVPEAAVFPLVAPVLHAAKHKKPGVKKPPGR